jgi:hypothetical protein
VESTRQGLASSSRIATSGQAHALVNETRPQLNAVASPTHLRLRHASLEVPSAPRLSLWSLPSCVACASPGCTSPEHRAGCHILQTCVTRLVTRYCSFHRLNYSPSAS